MAETNFPIPPTDRWTGWIGTLNPGDENYIFTESIYLNLFEKIFLRARRYGKNEDDSEDIANEVIELLFQKIQVLCYNKTTIIKSISGLCWAWIHIYFNNLISKDKTEVFVQTASHSEEVPLTDYIEDLTECIKKLDDLNRRIIMKYYFEDFTLEDIAKLENLTLNQIFRKKEQAERILYHHLKALGYT